MGNTYSFLIDKLDAFIRKYYNNLLIRGGIYALTILLLAYLSFALLEYFGQFSSAVRTVFFFSFLLLLLFVVYRFIFTPVAGLLRIGSRISHDQASKIIGDHFPEVSDKLLNTLQLHMQAETESNALLLASIEQRSEELKPVPFVQAINFKDNIRYLRYLAIPIGALVLILFINASIVKDSTVRLLQYNQEFEPQAPFNFVLLNNKLKGLQNDDLQFKLQMKGDVIPAEVFIELNGNRYKMLAKGNGNFTHEVKNLQRNFDFQFWADDFYSEKREFEVLAKPLLSGFVVQLDYPNYTGLPDEEIKNTGDLNLPEGTQVKWQFITRNTDYLKMDFGDTSFILKETKANTYRYDRKFFSSSNYYLKTGNKRAESNDSVLYRISVSPDRKPLIDVEEKKDSLDLKVRYFVGELNDDHGFTRLRFVYRKVGGNDTVVSLPVDKKRKEQQFYHIWSLDELNLKPGDKVEYYFEVWDNDGIHGPKATRSQSRLYEVPTEKEIKKDVEEQSEKLKKKMKEAIRESKDINKEIKDLKRKLLEKKQLEWQEKKQLDQLLDRQKKLEKKVDEIKKQNQQKNAKENEFTPQQKEILKKQKELEKLFNELFNDELKKMMEELKKLMEEQNKEKLQEELDKMQLEEKELNKQLDRMLEMYKKMEVEQNLEKQIEKMKDLAEEQEKLAEETEKEETPTEELKEKQDSLNKAFEELKEDMEKTDSLNKELEDPLDMEMPKEEMDDIQQDMKEGSENLELKKKGKAGKSQRDAAKKMKSLSDKMSAMMQEMDKEQQAEDYETLRSILENLVQLSFDQEELMKEFEQAKSYNPQYIDLVQRQKKVKDDMRHVEDSLLALSKRVIQLSNYINAEVGKINMNLRRAMEELSERHTNQARINQQYSMTSMNNLAVMLSEVLKNMQEDMMESSGGGGGGKAKSKPKSGNSKNLKKMKKMQKQLGDELKKMKDGMKKGDQPGSKEWAKKAAQQEAIRRMLEGLKKQLQEEGKGKEAGDLQKTIDEMEKLEKDLVNKRLNLESLKRQEDIETRLLEHEKAERERDQDDQRKSNEGKQFDRKLPPELEEYLKQKEKESELLKTIPPKLRPYYKEKTREYFRNIAR